MHYGIGAPENEHQLSNLRHYRMNIRFQLHLCLPLIYAVFFSLEYFLYAFYTGQQFYKLVSQLIFWLLAQGKEEILT